MKDNQNGQHTQDKSGKQPNQKPAEKNSKKEMSLEGPNVKKGKQNSEEDETTESKEKGHARAKHEAKKEVL